MTNQVHGTCVELSGVGLLLRGPSGSGKSDLALRLIDDGASLVADDRVDLALEGGRLKASAPALLAGKIEVRGMGVMRVPSLPRTIIGLVVDLVPEAMIERMPDQASCELLGVAIPLMKLAAMSVSAAARLRLAVATLEQPEMTVAAL